MAFQITSLYAALYTIVFLVLATHVTMRRTETGVSILHGDDMKLALRIRRHGNFVEHIPLVLLLMAFAETRGFPGLWLHVIGLVVLASRLAHAAGLSITNSKAALRIIGGTGTHLSMLVLVVFLIWSQF